MRENNTQKILKEAGLKITLHRVTVYDFLLKNHKPLSIKHIYEKLVKTGIDQVTVYRVVRSFVKAGLVKQIDLGEDQAYFEIVDEHDHHHVVCKKCKVIADFTGCHIESIITHALAQSKFKRIDTHSIELFGICKNCA